MNGVKVAHGPDMPEVVEAIARMRRGEIDGLEPLVVHFQQRGLAAAYFITGSRRIAEDVVQDAFVRAYEGIRRFDPSRAFAPWFNRIVVNLAIKAAQRAGRTDSLDAPEHGGVRELAGNAADPLTEALRAETSEAVWAAVQRLTPAERAVVVQRYYLEMTDSEIAKGSARAVGTVKHLLHRARRKLAPLLAQERLWGGLL